MFLIRRYFDVVRADGWLDLVWIIEAFDVGQVGDVESSDVVSSCESQVDEISVLGDVGIDRRRITSFGSEVVEQLCNALSAIFIRLEWIDDPDLAQVYSGGKSSRVRVSWDELDILDSSAVGNGDSADDCPLLEIPEAKSICSDNFQAWLQD